MNETVLIRPAAGMGITVYEAMEHCVEITGWPALMSYLKVHYDFLNPTDENVEIRHYTYDDRIDWDTFLVTVDGKATLFTNGDIKRS